LIDLFICLFVAELSWCKIYGVEGHRNIQVRIIVLEIFMVPVRTTIQNFSSSSETSKILKIFHLTKQQ